MIATQACRLVEQAVTGDEQAFAELVRGCQHTLYAAAFAVTRNEQDALDAVQDAVFKGWARLYTLREQAYFSTWMTRIVVRAAINLTRKRKPSAPLVADIPGPSAPLDEHMDIRRAIAALDEKARLCTVLYYFEDMPVAQIAQVVGIRPGTVKSRLYRAREQLRTVLEGYYDE